MQPELTSSERRALRGKGQLLDPVLKVGKGGVSPEFLVSFEEALSRHGLIKIKFVDHKDERRALAARLALDSSSALVQVVGNVAIFYRPSKPAEA